MVSLNFSSFSTFGSMKPGEFQTFSVSSLKMCFKRLRFKKSDETTSGDPSLDGDNLDFYLGEVTISSLGTSLGSVAVPPGDYQRVEFDLEDSCPSSNSLEVTNSNGSYTTGDRITIKFEGNFSLGTDDANLDLNIQQIMTALDSVSSDGDIRTQAESVSGSF